MAIAALCGPSPSVAGYGGRGRLILNTAFGPPISTPDRTGFFDRLVQALLSPLGYAVTVQKPPAERALMLANQGLDDGDGPRISGLDNEGNYPNLVRVDEKLLDVDFRAFTLDPALGVSGWDDLADLQVAIVTGWKILEQRLATHPRVVKVNDPDRLFRLLAHRRTDIVVIDRFSGIEAAAELQLRGIRVLDPALATEPMYLYLHRRHADLVQPVADALRAMKADGRYRQIYTETLGHVDSRCAARFAG
jgi:polar amino acid transport system substrate-binding protein